MFDIYDQIAEEFELLNYFLAQTKELRSLKTVKNSLFKLFFLPSFPQLNSVTTKIDTESGTHRSNLVIISTAFFKGSDMPKMVEINFWLFFLVGPSLAFFQINTVKTTIYLKSKWKQDWAGNVFYNQ